MMSLFQKIRFFFQRSYHEQKHLDHILTSESKVSFNFVSKTEKNGEMNMASNISGANLVNDIDFHSALLTELEFDWSVINNVMKAGNAC